MISAGKVTRSFTGIGLRELAVTKIPLLSCSAFFFGG